MCEMLPRENPLLGFGLLHQLLKLPPDRVARTPAARLGYLRDETNPVRGAGINDRLQALVETIDALEAIAVVSSATRHHRTAEMRAALTGVRVRSLSLRARSRGGGGGGGGADGADGEAARRAAMRALRSAMQPLVEKVDALVGGPCPPYLVAAGEVANWAAHSDAGMQQAVSRLLVTRIGHLALYEPTALHEACDLTPPTTTESAPSLLAHSLGAVAARASRFGWANARLVVTVARSALNDTTGAAATRSQAVERSIEISVPASTHGDVTDETMEVGDHGGRI